MKLEDFLTGSSGQLISSIEEANLNAWPAIQQVLLDGWLLRFSGSYSKRGNAIVPVYPGTQPVLQKIRYCENAYRREDLPTLFRMSSAPGLRTLDRTLAELGYEQTDASLVLTYRNGKLPTTSSQQFRRLTLDTWINVYCKLSGMPETATRLQKLLLKSIPCDAIYGVIVDKTQYVACGLAVVDDKVTGLFDILTDPIYRRRGHAQELILNLLRCGSEHGAETGYLQVAEDNEPARALYEHLGFQSLYRAWYRIRDPSERRQPDSP